MRKIRLVQMVLQPVLVFDDGESLTPAPCDRIVVPANEWNSFSSHRWPEIMEAQQAQLNQGKAGEDG